jgi:hypothetical protein
MTESGFINTLRRFSIIPADRCLKAIEQPLSPTSPQRHLKETRQQRHDPVIRILTMHHVYSGSPKGYKNLHKDFCLSQALALLAHLALSSYILSQFSSEC